MSLTISGYVRQFYRGNLFGATANSRMGQPAHNLITADMKAVRRAVKELGDYDYDEGEGGELMNKVQAFVDTYNHYVESANEMDDSKVNRYLSKLKKLTKEHADEFSEIGITIQSSGKLKVDKKELQDATRFEVGRLFSADSEYSKELDIQVKRTNRMILRNNLNVPKQSVQNKKNQSGTAAAAMMPPVADEQLAQQLSEVLSGSKFDQTV